MATPTFPTLVDILPRVPPTPEELLAQGHFPCVSCGACCTKAGLVPELKSAGYPLPNSITCRYLTKSNTCKIYSFRPPLCRIEASIPPETSKTKWFLDNLTQCLNLLGTPKDPFTHKKQAQLKSLITTLQEQPQ